MEQISKNEFITAYRWAFGATVKQAKEAWKKESDSYKFEIVKGWKIQCELAFYND